MTRLIVLLAMVAAVVALPFRTARAEDSVALSRSSTLIGEHFEIQVRVLAPPGATVELTPGTPGWAGVELVGIDAVTQVEQADGVLWFFEARVAAFLPGTIPFAPTVTIVQGSEARSVSLPPVELTAVWSLAPDAELVLTPLAPPVGIPGAESPLLRPAIALGAVVGLALLGLLTWFLARRLARRLAAAPAPEVEATVPASLAGAEQIIDSDPVGAYRLMSSVVKTELARRYGLRATALTTTELRKRLESGGDRWHARLVSGLLEECDSVIYAGYRPAAERRQHDLTMAREIVEVGA